MENISKKLILISNLYRLNKNNLRKCEKLVNNVNINSNLSEINNNSLKMIGIRFEVKKELSFDVNEDKQRQCYKQLKCFWPKCRYSCERLCNFNQHISNHLNKKQFVCDECNKHFNCKSNLIRHKRCVHSTDSQFVCNIINCNKKFTTKTLLHLHKQRHSSLKSFGCIKCDKRFKTKSDLIEHQSTHSSEKSFGCDKCDKRFKTYLSIRNHKKFVHSNIRSFVCPQSDCNKSFKQRKGLYYHKMRFHSDIKRHKCFHNNCDESFVTSSDLKQHIGHKHSTERPYKCDLNNCNSSFKSRGSLFYHKKIFHLKNN